MYLPPITLDGGPWWAQTASCCYNSCPLGGSCSKKSASRRGRGMMKERQLVKRQQPSLHRSLLISLSLSLYLSPSLPSWLDLNSPVAFTTKQDPVRDPSVVGATIVRLFCLIRVQASIHDWESSDYRTRVWTIQREGNLRNEHLMTSKSSLKTVLEGLKSFSLMEESERFSRL